MTDPDSFTGPARPGRGRCVEAAPGRAAAVPVPQRLGAAPAQPPLPARRGARGLGRVARRRAGVRRPAHRPAVRAGHRPGPGLLRDRLLRPRHGVRRGRPRSGHRVAHERAVCGRVPLRRHLIPVLRDPGQLALGERWLPEPRRTRATSTPTRTRRRTGRCDPRPALREVWADRAPRRAVPLPAPAVLRDALRLLQPVHPGQPAGRARCDAYLSQLRRQAERGPRRRWAPGRGSPAAAIGGGTPTYLTAGELAELFDIVAELLGLGPRAVPLVGGDLARHRDPGPARGAGPARRHPGQHRRAELPRRRGARGRPAAATLPRWTARSAAIREAAASRCSTSTSSTASPARPPHTWARFAALRALDWQPEELYLYPLYVRPLTGLGRRRPLWTIMTRGGTPADGAVPRRGGTRCAPAGTGSCPCVSSAGTSAAQPGPDRVQLPGRRDGRAGLRMPARTPGACTTRSTTRSASAGCGTVHRRLPEPGRPATSPSPRSGYRLDRAEQRRRRLAGQVAAAGRRGWTPPGTRRVRRPRLPRRLPRTWPSCAAGAGWPAIPPGPAGSR